MCNITKKQKFYKTFIITAVKNLKSFVNLRQDIAIPSDNTVQ